MTYNHAPFIRQCLDGFLMQKTSFSIEILLHDDASTDGTSEIVREYAAKYPEVLFPIYEVENQYSKHHQNIDLYNYSRARGKYIAYCEGDDYWTDSLKLQKQVDFMEAHLDYSVCFHNFIAYDARINSFEEVVYEHPVEMIDGGTDVDFRMCVGKSYGGQPLTMLFRKSMYDLGWMKQYKGYRDTHEIYHLLQAGKGRYLDFVGGVYVRHNGGVSTSNTTLQSCKDEREHILELYLNTKDKILGQYLLEILIWNYSVYEKNCRIADFYRVMIFYFKRTPEIAFGVFEYVLKHRIRNYVYKIRKKVLHTRLRPIRVLCFHAISDEFDQDCNWACDWMQTSKFKEIIGEIKKRYTFISLPDAYNHIIKDKFRIRNYAVLTFDDGDASVKNIVPWLIEQGIPITLFVCPDFLNGGIRDDHPNAQFISTNELGELLKIFDPYVTVASHGYYHKKCSQIPKSEFPELIRNAESFLKQYNSHKVPFFAYPFGDYNEFTNSILKNEGLVPVYVDGGKNFNDVSGIHRELL